MIRFGPSGNSQSFYDQGYKSSVQIPAWLRQLGLNAYEYQCGKGVKITEPTARQIGEQAALHDIFVSIHAPYYINMASSEPEKRENSKRYILQSMQAARWMGARRVVLHTGSYAKVDKIWALQSAKQILKETLVEADAQGYADIQLCPELLGKSNQLGSLEEILEMCRVEERLIPAIDFGHLHARGRGCLRSTEDFAKAVQYMENALGCERMKNIHIHFSRIEFTAAGEKKHWTYDDVQYGPDFDPLAEVIAQKGMEPVIICESMGSMAEDALKFKAIYERIAGGSKQ
jgi:deoxyribonuclease IV